MSETKTLAKIESAFLGREDHGIFTCWLNVDYGGGGQGIGMYALDKFDEAAERRVGTAYGIEFIIRLMRACGVDEWSKLPGRTVYVIKNGDGLNARVLGVEPLPTESGERFMFDELREDVT